VAGLLQSQSFEAAWRADADSPAPAENAGENADIAVSEARVISGKWLK
jgi:hypothetical protein